MISALCLAVPGEQPLAQAAKTQIGRKPDGPDHEDAGENALGAKRLLRLQHYISHADYRADHLGGNNHDQRNAPREADAREDVGQAGLAGSAQSC